MRPILPTVLLLALLLTGPLAAEVTGSAGPYRLAVRTDPPVVAVGRAEVIVRITDGAGQPVPGATVRVFARMPEMDMGEREETAAPDPSAPGVYRAPATFAMEGAYVVRVSVEGPAGRGVGEIPLRTGQSTAPARPGGAGSLLRYLPWALGAVLVAFVLYRLFRTGLRPDWRALLRPETLVGVILIAGALIASQWAVRTFRRPNSMPLVDALASDMSRMPPPPGEGPVELAVVARGPVRDTVRYTGSAVGYVEQDVFPRVTGWIVWMPLYAGDRVRAGQLLARLDTRELASRTDQRRAERAMAEQMASIARLEYRQTLAAAAQARAEAGAKEGALEEVRRMHQRAQAMLAEARSGVLEARSDLRAAQADLSAAREERVEAEEMLQSARAAEPETEAMLAAARADQDYRTRQIARLRVLLDNGAVSGEEFQREEAAAKGADASVRQAESRLQAVRSDIRAAAAKVRRAAAMVDAAGARISQAQARVEAMDAKVEQSQAEVAALAGRVRMAEGDLEAARAGVRAAQSMAEAGAGRIRQAEAGLRGAGAALTTAAVVQGYTEMRSRVDGVVTRRLISPGVLVGPGQAILRVAQISPIRLQANVSEVDLARIRVGSNVTAWTPAGNPVRARITSIAPEVDPLARTAQVEALHPNTGRGFVPGQSVRMEITTASRANALRIPASAVLWESAPSSTILSTRRASYVWLAEPAGDGSYRVRRRPVRVGAWDGRFTEVLSGLEEGDRVVARGQFGLREGDAVAGVPWESDGPARLPSPPRGTGNVPGQGPGHSGHEGH